MNIICNIIVKDEGRIDFESDSVKIGYLPESPALFGYMNGYEYLDYIGACCDFEGSIKERTSEVLTLTGMQNNAQRKIKGYSRGMVQRIGIAAALYANPDLLILDPEGRAEVIDIVSNLAASGSTILLCTHILNDVERVANKVGILRNGVLAVEGSLTDVRMMFDIGTAVTVRTQNAAAATEVLQGLDIVERVDAEYYGDVTAVAKDGVSEAELFYKTVNALASNQIVPEGVWFKRFSLEQVYLGINSGQLLQY
jgi:ABC-type multidrug transport system ATPase subunit